MNTTRSILLVASGVAAGVALVLSCSDGPKHVDAATPACDCPAAELPIAGRIVIIDDVSTIAPGSVGGAGRACPINSIRLSGSCTLATEGPSADITLEEAGFYNQTDQNWSCTWRNNTAAPVMVKGSITCLKATP